MMMMTFIYPHLHQNQNSSSLQIEVGYIKIAWSLKMSFNVNSR